ncbi:DUF1456 family protein [Yersinia wautersii]|uniref:DUF1456 family protein n=1 Tax=Yersinia wautersii TaxID=1341643 RepID=UPI0005B426B4|nr:DUF1456 family protein [Yersinia wautersii]
MVNNLIPTNDVFKEICLLLRIHRDKAYIISLFEKKGWEVSRSKLQAWSKKSGEYNKDYRPMPEQALRDFILALKEEKLIDE